MGDPIEKADQQRQAVLAELAQADEQAQAWQAERNRLVIQAAALNISARRISQYVSLSDVGVGKLVRRERDRDNVQ